MMFGLVGDVREKSLSVGLAYGECAVAVLSRETVSARCGFRVRGLEFRVVWEEHRFPVSVRRASLMCTRCGCEPASKVA